MALVLNIHTGYVSLQFHVKFDEAFQTVQQDKWNATWLISTGFTTQTNKVPPNEAITPSGKRRKTQEQQIPNGEIRDHPGKMQMVAVTANGPTRHMMLLAPEQQVPANPASTIPPATVADEHPVASERKPQPNMTPITTRSGHLVKPVPRLINLMMLELVSTTKGKMNVEGELLSFSALNHEPEELSNPILAYKAENHDISRLHEAMQAKDQREFKAAMEKEVNDQIDNGNFFIIPQSKVPTSQEFGRWYVNKISLHERLRNIKLVLLLMAPGCEKEKNVIKPMPLVEKSVFTIGLISSCVDQFNSWCSPMQRLLVYMYLSQLMSPFTNYLKGASFPRWFLHSMTQKNQ